MFCSSQLTISLQSFDFLFCSGIRISSRRKALAWFSAIRFVRHGQCLLILSLFQVSFVAPRDRVAT